MAASMVATAARTSASSSSPSQPRAPWLQLMWEAPSVTTVSRGSMGPTPPTVIGSPIVPADRATASIMMQRRLAAVETASCL